MTVKTFISNKCCLKNKCFELSKESWGKNISGFHKKILSRTSVFKDQHIRMISEGSRDTEDWSNDAENSALHHRNK